MRKYRLGVDAGGTFTDFVLSDPNGELHLFKSTSTPEDGTKAIADGLNQISEKLNKPIEEILSQMELCVNGTTVGLNALIQHTGAKTGLICTAGHEDSLEIRLGHKEEGHRYDAQYPQAQILVERHLRLPIHERVLSDGSVKQPLNEDEVRQACEYFKKHNVEAVAISFLWSVANEQHERRAAEIVRELLPNVYVSVGVEVYPQMREYTRTSTTVTNAYLGPVLEKYVTKIDQFFQDKGVAVPVRYFQSNGGMASRDVMVSRAVNAINSGPASAPQAGLHIGKPFGINNIITVDMGGTSFDITLTHNGITNINKDIDFLRYRIGIPMIQVETLGAGGGSIAWIDSMGLLNVGPQSAGASPGPVCYMRGGTAPTVTDTNVALGYLNQESLLGGRVPINSQTARSAIEVHIAKPLGISVEKAAYGIYSIVNQNMVNGIRRVSIERGYDPRDFALVGAGGATGLHITALARDIGITTVLVPKLASGLCAFAQTLSDVKYNYMAACPMRIDGKENLNIIEKRFVGLEQAAKQTLIKEGIADEKILMRRSLDMRYVGQVHECSVDIGNMEVNPENLPLIRATFDAYHEQLFTYCEPDSMVEIVNIESTIYRQSEHPEITLLPEGKGAEQAIKTHRNMIFSADAIFEEVPVYDGDLLGANDELYGPAVIEEITTTIVINPGWHLVLDSLGTYVLTDKQEKNA